MKAKEATSKLTLNHETLLKLTGSEKSGDGRARLATVSPPICPPCSVNQQAK
jgi:hypothetical protein